jgi:hypothetical protein
MIQKALACNRLQFIVISALDGHVSHVCFARTNFAFWLRTLNSERIKLFWLQAILVIIGDNTFFRKTVLTRFFKVDLKAFSKLHTRNVLEYCDSHALVVTMSFVRNNLI